MNIKRYLKKNLSKFTTGRVNVLYGPRRVGKTTLVKEIYEEFAGEKIYVTGDDERVKSVFSTSSLSVLEDFVANSELLIIDEAQRIPKIGLNLKLLIDQHPNMKILVTGSASFELAGQIGEPLTGRKFEYLMLPLSTVELYQSGLSKEELRQNLHTLLIYGSYPDIYTQNVKLQKKLLLEELVNSLLLKDILELERIKSSKIILDLLRMLAYQIGSEVSQTELSSNLNIDYKTVGRYLDLLEKSFVIFNLRGYSRNLRKEITKKSKYYFYDNGVRNALISDFNKFDVRNDQGYIWENFIISERIKFLHYSRVSSNNYFWRTWDQEEVDWVEEREGKLFAYEFKVNPKTRCKIPKTLKTTYPESQFKVITPENYLKWILK